MRIHRIPRHERDFVIVANKAIQDPRLSHTARGILALMLSLPDGVRENVRTLSDKYPQGRAAVAKAVAELRKFGYWVTRTERDPESGLIVSAVDVFEDPMLAGAVPRSSSLLTAPSLRAFAAAAPPVPGPPVTGEVVARESGAVTAPSVPWSSSPSTARRGP